jgi:hypothetical protein
MLLIANSPDQMISIPSTSSQLTQYGRRTVYGSRRCTARNMRKRFGCSLPTLSAQAYYGVVFEPQMQPEIALAAALAAVPPILFWFRVIMRERERAQEIEARERAREVGGFDGCELHW